jgi:hypothetical protein
MMIDSMILPSLLPIFQKKTCGCQTTICRLSPRLDLTTIGTGKYLLTTRSESISEESPSGA